MFSRENRERTLLVIGGGLLLTVLMSGEFLVKNLSVFVAKHSGDVGASVVKLSEERGTPNMLSIPSLHIEAPVLYISTTGEKAYQEALAHGVVHYPGTAMPGEFGNAYFFGHSGDVPWATGTYKTVFAPLPQISLGDEIRITDNDGVSFVYHVYETQIVWPKDLSALSQFEKKEKILSLQTSYPLGTALQRFIVRAKLLEN